MALADFSRAATLGFQTGKEMAPPSAMNLLVKGMLAQKEKLLERKFELQKQEAKYQQDVALEIVKGQFKGVKTSEETALTVAKTEKEKALTEKYKRPGTAKSRKVTAADIKALGGIALAQEGKPSLFERFQANFPFFGGVAKEKIKRYEKAKQQFGGVDPAVLDIFTQQFQQTGGIQSLTEPTAAPFTPEQERLILDNMEAHAKSREEVIEALQARGLLPVGG